MLYGPSAMIPRDEIDRALNDTSATISRPHTNATDWDVDQVYPGLVAFAAILVAYCIQPHISVI